MSRRGDNAGRYCEVRWGFHKNVLVLFCMRIILWGMNRATLSAPIPPSPAVPVVGASDFAEIGVAIDAARRRGRGAQTTPSGRLESEARAVFDDGWQRLDELPP